MSEAVRFYLDEHVNHALLRALRRHGFDAVAAGEVPLSGEEDAVHLAYATSQGRVMVTQDRDFLRLHAEGRYHAGIVYLPQHTPVRAMIEAVLLVGGVMSPEELANTVQYM